MTRVERFEDLIAWQKARQLAAKVYQASREGEFRRDSSLARQIQRAATSIAANIAEGFERGGRGEFHQFLSTAKASCAELRSQLYVARDAGYLTQPEFEELLALATEVGRILGGLRSAVAHQRAGSSPKSS
jgi:four helix bundle protein